MKYIAFKHITGKFLAVHDTDDETILTLTDELEPDGLYKEIYFARTSLKEILEAGFNIECYATGPPLELKAEDFTQINATINQI